MACGGLLCDGWAGLARGGLDSITKKQEGFHEEAGRMTRALRAAAIRFRAKRQYTSAP
jgi:hypothetical protein